MNVLFYRYNSICEPIYINALKALDINVIEETTEIYQKDVTGKDMLDNLKSIFANNKILFVMSINYYPVLSVICNAYHIPYVSVIVDSPVLELYSDTIKNPYNRVFIFDKALYNRHKGDNPDCIFHMPLFADIPHIDKVLKDNAAMSGKYAEEISFIGSLYTEKSPYNQVKNLPPYMKGYFDALIESQLKIYGYSMIYELLSDEMVAEFMKYEQMYEFPEKARKDYKAVLAYEYLGVKVSEQERIRLLKSVSEQFSLGIYTQSDTLMMPNAKNKGFASSLLEMPLIFHNSKINLQITARTIETGLSQRVWDVLSAGGFLLTNYQEEIFDYFEPGTDLDCFGSPQELIEKIDFYLKNDELRKSIARNGREKIQKYHTPLLRMREIIGKVV